MGFLSNLYDSHKSFFRGVISVVAAILVWEAFKPFINRFFFAAPSDIVLSLISYGYSGQLINDTTVSISEFAYGYVVGAVLSIPLGLLVGRAKILEDILDPFITIFNALPKVALAPLIILLFGIGVISKVVLVVTGVFFPVFINTFVGAKKVDATLIEASISFGAKQKDLLFKVILPAALPYIVAGLRLAIGLGLVFVVVGEFYASKEGIGHMISLAGGQYDTALVIGGVLLLAILALIFTEILRRLEMRVAPWQASMR